MLKPNQTIQLTVTSPQSSEIQTALLLESIDENITIHLKPDKNSAIRQSPLRNLELGLNIKTYMAKTGDSKREAEF